MKKRIFSLILTALLLILSACSDAGSNPEETAAAPGADASVPETEPETEWIDTVPADVKYDGLTFLIGWSTPDPDSDECAPDLDEVTGDIVGESVHQRNLLVEDKLDIDPGKVTDLAGLMAVVSLEKGVDDLRNGHVDGLVLAPANPLNMKRDRYAYANQQQYLDAAFGVASSMLILVSDRVKIGMLTSHLPLREALEAVTTERVLQGIRGFAMSLKNDFGITAPKIAVLGLNPHAGMSEAFGREEVSLIEPALLQARNEDVFAFGPFAADTFFGSDAWLKYDGVLAMYHDQAMVPFQLLSAQGGAYCFSGLPAVCTAPVMECQYDLANQNVANPDAFRKALYLACDIVRQRAR